MINPNYDVIYANLLDKIHTRLRRMPKRSLDDIIAEYAQEAGITLNTDSLKKDVLQKVQSTPSCSKCGVQGDLFKVGDDEYCSGCKDNGDLSRDMTVTPAPASQVFLASSTLFMSKHAEKSLDDTMKVIEERLKVIADDFEGTSLERNMDNLNKAFRRILSGADRQLGEFSNRGTDVVPAIIERAFSSYNLSRTFRDAVVTDTAIRNAIYDYVGEPVHYEDSFSGVDDVGKGHIIDRPDNNDGGIFNAVTTL